MIERAERLVPAEQIRPGMLVEGTKGRMTVSEVRVGLDEVTLCGRLVGASPGTKRRHLDRHRHDAEVVVLAPGDMLDLVEDVLVQSFDARLATVDGGAVAVTVDGVVWDVPLRRPVPAPPSAVEDPES